MPIAPTSTPKLRLSTATGGSSDKGGSSGTRTLRCRTVATGRFRQVNYIRDLPPQPVPQGACEGQLGEELVPSASEALLAAFGSCLAIGIHANAAAQRILVRSLELELSADIETDPAVRGSRHVQPRPIGFDAVRVLVRLDAEAPWETLAALVNTAKL